MPGKQDHGTAQYRYCYLVSCSQYFQANTEYTATITLTAKSGYTLTGVTEDFFTGQGPSVSNNASSGVVTAIFPVTPAIPTNYTLTLTGDNISSVPAPGAIAANVGNNNRIPGSGKQVAAFIVGGADKKDELAANPANQYTFTITANTTVAVAYENIPSGGDEVPPAL